MGVASDILTMSQQTSCSFVSYNLSVPLIGVQQRGPLMGAGEMGQSVKCLSCNYDDQTWISAPTEKPGELLCIITRPLRVGVRVGIAGSLEFSSVSLVKVESTTFNNTPCLNIKWRVTEEYTYCLHACCTCARPCTHRSQTRVWRVDHVSGPWHPSDTLKIQQFSYPFHPTCFESLPGASSWRALSFCEAGH